MAVDNTYSGSSKTLMWMAIGRGRTNGSWASIQPLLRLNSGAGTTYPNGNIFDIDVERYDSNYTGVLKDLVIVPFKAFKPNAVQSKDYRAGIGVQCYGGKLKFYYSTAYYDP